jgi:Peptidase family M1 domain
MARRSLLAALLSAALCAAPLAAAPDATYTALRNARPDGRKIAVQGVSLDRDVFHFQFESGTFHLLALVDGRTVGAVFIGRGSYRLTPATPAERRQLALSSGAGEGFESLSDSFDNLVLFFVDDTDAELANKAPIEKGSPDPKAMQVYEAYLKKQKKDFKTNFHLRVLQDLLNAPGITTGLFLALIDGQKVPPVLAAVDPNGAEDLQLGGRLGGEETVFYVADSNKGGVWYLSDRKAELATHRPHLEKRLADALDYRIETTVEKGDDLAGIATVRLTSLVPSLRVLPVLLMSRLRIGEASWSAAPAGTAPPAWQPAAWVQEDKDEDADAAVVFPQPLQKGATVLLRLAYRGDKVLRDVGDKNYVVGARESWYPNLGVFSDPAAFELVYRVPAGNEVISVGRKVDEKTEGKLAVSTWKTEGQVQVAGFNYGKFKKLEKQDEDSKLQIAVFTNPGTPDIVREINSMGGPDLGSVNTNRLAEGAMADGINSARLFSTYFGPLPQTQVAITQQSNFFFGQSWPSLIFLPYIAFLDGTQRQRLGLTGAKDFVDQVGYHEFAHQWWGHLVGAATYRDVWLEEGFAEFSAALAVQHTKGWGEYDRFWNEARKTITGKYPGNAMPHYQAGPITQGLRLGTSRSPSAYQAMIYEKGGYVLHMLRMLMWDNRSPTPDEKFIAMMKDYTATYGGKFATTADFQKIVEKHMVPALNATGDGKMDWFFQQWVYGTEVPRYVTDLSLKPEGDTWHLTGKITQEGVSPSFRTPVPIYLEFDKGEKIRIGLVGMIGETTKTVDIKDLKLPKKPKRALVNGRGEVLARD